MWPGGPTSRGAYGGNARCSVSSRNRKGLEASAKKKRDRYDTIGVRVRWFRRRRKEHHDSPEENANKKIDRTGAAEDKIKELADTADAEGVKKEKESGRPQLINPYHVFMAFFVSLRPYGVCRTSVGGRRRESFSADSSACTRLPCGCGRQINAKNGARFPSLRFAPVR